MREITGAIVAMTLTLVAVFAPLGFTGGLTGALFREFAFALAGSVVISGFVALTVSPMMSALLLKGGEPGRFQRVVDRTSTAVENWYERRLSSSLNYRPVTLLMVARLMATTGFLFLNTSSELAPEEDQGALFAIVNAPRYATTEYTQLYVNQFDELTTASRRSDLRFSIVGWGADEFGLRHLDAEGLGRSRAQPGRDPAGHPGPDRQGGRRPGLRLLAAIAARHRGRAADLLRRPVDRAARPGLRGRRGDPPKAAGGGRFIVVQNSLSFDAPQVTVTIDRERAAALGVPITRSADLVAARRRGPGRALRPRLQQLRHHRRRCRSLPRQPGRLGEFFVRAANGVMVPLSSVVSVSTQGPRRRRSSSSTSSTRPPFPRCRCPA
jgi:multidrug efflux pump